MDGVGLFGGTFDPIHRGHLLAAEKVKKAFGLKEIVFIPSALPPHKPEARVTGARDRLAMLRLALFRFDGFSVSDCEIRRQGFSFTIDTVQFFLENASNGTRMYLIMGHDAFLEMNTWRSFEKILEQIPIIVMKRPGFASPPDGGGQRVLDSFIRTTLSKDYRLLEDGAGYTHPTFKPIHLFQGVLVDISSSDIRERIRKGREISSFVPDAVKDYIHEKGLYR